LEGDGWAAGRKEDEEGNGEEAPFIDGLEGVLTPERSLSICSCSARELKLMSDDFSDDQASNGGETGRRRGEGGGSIGCLNGEAVSNVWDGRRLGGGMEGIGGKSVVLVSLVAFGVTPFDNLLVYLPGVIGAAPADRIREGFGVVEIDKAETSMESECSALETFLVLSCLAVRPIYLLAREPGVVGT